MYFHVSDYNGLFIFNYPMPKHSFHEIKPRHLRKKWDFSTNMKVFYVFGQISNQSVPFYFFYLSLVLVYRFISSSLLRDLWPSVAKRSRSNRWNLYFHVSNDNGLFIFNYPMPTPCLARDLKNIFLFCKTQISLLWSLFVLRFLYDYIEKKAWMSFPNTRRFVIYS